MKRPTSLRKARKRLRKKKAATARDQSRQRVKARLDRFPDCTINAGNAPSEFVEAITKGIRQIRGDPNKHLGPWAPYFREAKRYGFGAAFKEMIRQNDHYSESDRMVLLQQFYLSTAVAVTATLSEEVLNRHFPQAWFYARFSRATDNALQITFRTLLRAKTPGGTAYYARHQPRIVLDDRRYRVAYYRHAIDRLRERAVCKRSYTALTAAFHLFSDARAYETATLTSGETALVFTTPSDPMEPESNNLVTTHYRLGYGPLVYEGDLAIATTFLAVGMRGTPEYEVLRKAHLTRDRRYEIKTSTIEASSRWFSSSCDRACVDWFAEQGHPLLVERLKPPASPARQTQATTIPSVGA